MTCEPIESDVHSWHKNHASSAIQRRRGWTLLELMIVIAIAGTLIGLVGALL